MTDRLRGALSPAKHMKLSHRLLGGGAFFVGVAAAGEVAAHAIASASGGHLGHPGFVGLYNPIDGLRWASALNGHCVVQPWMQSMNPLARLRGGVALPHRCATASAFIFGVDAQAAACLAGGLATFGAVRFADWKEQAQGALGRTLEPVRDVAGHPAQLVIVLGTATGILHDLGHKAGIKRGQVVRLVDGDVSQDLILLGGKGSGKTTRGLNPILLQSLRQGCGALVFNVKGDYDRTVLALARKAGRKVRIIGVGEGAERIDLLAGVSPEMAGTYLASLLLLAKNDSSDATFWNTAAVNLARGVLSLLWYIPSCYSLPGLFRYVFIEGFRKQVDEVIGDLYRARSNEMANADDVQRASIERDLRNIDDGYQEIADFAKQTHEIQSGAQMQLRQILADMIRPEMEDAFGKPQPAGAQSVRLEQLYEDGAVFVVNANLQDYGKAAAAAMCFLKLRFYNTMEKRRLRIDCDQTRRVGLFIDECQEIVACSHDGMSDHKFLGMSRDTGTFCVFAAQSIETIASKINNMHMTKALLANLRQRIYFRTEDVATVQDALYLLGQTEVDRETTGKSRDAGAWFGSQSTSHQLQVQAVADASLIRSLKKGEALALLSIGEESADDVIAMEQELVNMGALA